MAKDQLQKFSGHWDVIPSGFSHPTQMLANAPSKSPAAVARHAIGSIGNYHRLQDWTRRQCYRVQDLGLFASRFFLCYPTSRLPMEMVLSLNPKCAEFMFILKLSGGIFVFVVIVFMIIVGLVLLLHATSTGTRCRAISFLGFILVAIAVAAGSKFLLMWH
jgi:hypothetical protein